MAFDFIISNQKLPPNSFIGEVNISKLTRKEVVDKLNRSFISEVFPHSIVLSVSSDESFSFLPRELGLYYLSEKTANNIFSLPQNTNYFLSLQKRLSQHYHVFTPSLSFTPSKTEAILSELAQQINAPAIDAKIEFDEKTGGYHIYPDNPSRKLNVEKTLEKLRRALLNGGYIVSAEVEYSFDQKITEESLRSMPPVHKIASFTTYFGSHDSPNRIHNIKLIASWLDGKLIMPDGIFSLTEQIGDFSPQRGFRQAFVISNNELVPEYGGGTCQIATTLYNVVSLADLKVIARRNHSFYFNIYPLGRDATVYPGSADFKFQNDTGRPILIKTTATNHKLSFSIYGTPTSKEVTFSSPAIYMASHGGKYIPTSYKTIIHSGAPFRTVVKRTVTNKDSKEVLKEEFIRSYYRLYGDGVNVPIKRREPI